MHRNRGVGSWIARRAAMAPARTAVVFGDRRLTYRELDERITRLAHGLERRGIGEGDRVAFLGRNHTAALEVLFACGLLGALAVPLHPGFDDAALSRILEMAEPAALVVTEELLPKLARTRTTTRNVFTTGAVTDGAERFEDLIATGSREPLDRVIDLDHPCLLAFSSGTTGRSKGVVLTHGNVTFNAINTQSCFGYVRDDVLLSSAPLHRTGGLGFTLTMLFAGGTCVLEERADPELWLRLVERHRVTAVFDAVGSLEAIARSPSFTRADLSSLRRCATGGSYVPPRLVAAFRNRGLILQPGYGLTEASPLVLVVDRDEVATHPGAAGRPPMFTAVRIVDAQLEDVAPGELGELLASGPNVTPGYYRDPMATERALVDGWLRTGDAAWAATDGMVTVVGRMKDALVLGGKRVHPGPIEEALRDQGARDCAIVQRAPEGAPLVFVVAGDGLDRERVLSTCRAHLGATPELHVVAALPKNANGKVLRDALRVEPRARTSSEPVPLRPSIA